MSNDTAKGKAKQVGGEIEELGGKFRQGVANITGDEEAKARGAGDEARGKLHKAEGKVQEAWGQTKKAISNAVDD